MEIAPQSFNFETEFVLERGRSGQQAYGCVEQLNILKRSNRYLKVVLSIGGWNFSLNGRFASAVSTDAKRAEFARSAVGLMKDWGFDGVDIDWEYPSSASEADNYLSLLKVIRAELDAYAAKNELDYHFLLTAAVPAGPQHYGLLNLTEIAKVADTLNLMGYDYAGTFSTLSGHHANLYPNTRKPEATSFSTDKAVADYIAAGVPKGKLCLGMPAYGRSFDGTEGPGQPYVQPGTPKGKGNWETGTWDYKVLPKPGAKEIYDEAAGATYSYDPATKEMISYDTVEMLQRKLLYIKEKGMGGSMFWEASGDRNDSKSLIGASFETLRPLKKKRNNLSYADSQYTNIALDEKAALKSN